MAVVDTNRGWRGTWCSFLERDRENCLTGDGVEVGPWRIGPGCLGLQALTFNVRSGRSRAGDQLLV